MTERKDKTETATREARRKTRLNAVKRLLKLYESGQTMRAAATIVARQQGISVSSLYYWLGDYRHGGESALGDNYKGRTSSTWTERPDLKKEIEILLAWEPNLSALEIRDRLVTADKERKLPSVRTISRLLESRRGPSKRISRHSRRSFLDRYPEVGKEIDTVLASSPEATIEAIRDELRAILEIRNLPVPGHDTIRRYINRRKRPVLKDPS